MAKTDAAKKLAERLYVERTGVALDRLEATDPEYQEEKGKCVELGHLLKGALNADGYRVVLNLDNTYAALAVKESEAFYLQGLIDGMELAELMAKGEFCVDRGETLIQTGPALDKVLGQFALEDMEEPSHYIARIKEDLRRLMPGVRFEDEEEDASAS
ncbi:MAG: hypothetical protein AB1576_03485 [Bacillota bacterium]|jgi:hypothetical protein